MVSPIPNEDDDVSSTRRSERSSARRFSGDALQQHDAVQANDPEQHEYPGQHAMHRECSAVVAPHADPAVHELGSPHLATSLWRQRMFVVAGSLALVLAVIGALLPIVPTTPFVLLASACFMRGSSRLHRTLRQNRWFGPAIANWEEHHCVPRKTKAVAIVAMLFSLAVSGVFFVEALIGRVALALIGLAVTAYLWRLPSEPPRDASQASLPPTH